MAGILMKREKIIVKGVLLHIITGKKVSLMRSHTYLEFYCKISFLHHCVVKVRRTTLLHIHNCLKNKGVVKCYKILKCYDIRTTDNTFQQSEEKWVPICRKQKIKTEIKKILDYS